MRDFKARSQRLRAGPLPLIRRSAPWGTPKTGHRWTPENRLKHRVCSAGALLLLSVAGLSAAVHSELPDAVMRGDKVAVQKLMEQHPDVNISQADGATALHWAVFRSDKEIVNLLRAGANAKAANREGATPLWLACVNGDAAIIATLLDAGADANEKLQIRRRLRLKA